MNILPKHIFVQTFLLSHLFMPITATCQERNSCEDEFKFITQTYNNGDWSGAKNASINFINNWDKNAIKVYYCKTYISQVYYYLIKSYLRLYNVDSAGFYYFKALKNDYKINIDTTDKKIFDDLGRVRKHSIDIYLGFNNSDFRKYQLGLRYGVSSKMFLDASFNKRHFNHVSYKGNGLFGKPIVRDVNKFPGYDFNIQGYEAYLEMESYYQIPIFVSPKNADDIVYVSPGVFVTYYLNSHVNTWTLTMYESPTTEKTVHLPDNNNQRYTQIDTFGVKMDLKQLYKNRLNGGFIMNISGNFNLIDRWQVVVALKFAVGINNRYKNSTFSEYKPGVNYFFLVAGVGRKYFKFRPRKS